MNTTTEIKMATALLEQAISRTGAALATYRELPESDAAATALDAALAELRSAIAELDATDAL